ncbi:hypothetical protein TNCV_4806221 [Trichonephila clavipes]|nr:hypothetical protein TNCV_4806221 [Trichonephila clavipes]
MRTNLKTRLRESLEESVLKRPGFPYWCLFKGGMRQTESLLFRCSRDYYAAFGPCHPSCGEARDRRGNCTGHFSAN